MTLWPADSRLEYLDISLDGLRGVSDLICKWWLWVIDSISWLRDVFSRFRMHLSPQAPIALIIAMVTYSCCVLLIA